MHPFDIAQEFIDICARDREPAALKAAFGRAIQALGFRHFACCSHVDPLDPPAGAVVLLDYPPQWVELFSARRLDRVDPVFRFADRAAIPFSWDEPAFLATLDTAQRAILAEARAMGLDRGYTIPIHAPLTLAASCSLVPDSDRIDRAAYGMAHLMASYLHEALAPLVAAHLNSRYLSKRERECLELAAQGKSDWAIGQILGIGERTARTYIERTKRRFRVASRTQAVVQALFHHSISFGDVLRADGAATRPEGRAPDPDSGKEGTRPRV